MRVLLEVPDGGLNKLMRAVESEGGALLTFECLQSVLVIISAAHTR